MSTIMTREQGPGRCFGVFAVDFEQVFGNWMVASFNHRHRLENLQCHEHL